MSLESKIIEELEKFKIEIKSIDTDNIVLFDINSNELLNFYRAKVNNMILSETKGCISVELYLELIKPCSEAQRFLEEYFETLCK